MPAQVVSVWVIDTQLPASSITEMCVVKPGLLSFLRSGSSPRRILAATSTACSSDSSSVVGTGLKRGSVRWLPRIEGWTPGLEERTVTRPREWGATSTGPSVNARIDSIGPEIPNSTRPATTHTGTRRAIGMQITAIKAWKGLGRRTTAGRDKASELTLLTIW